METYKMKMEAFLNRMNETLGEVSLVQLAVSANGPDKSLAHDTLQKMQEIFESVYGKEPVGQAEEYILAPAVFRGKKSGVTALGLVGLDLLSSGEHFQSAFFTPCGIMYQSGMEDDPRTAEYVQEHFIPYDYWYTPAVENDIHMDSVSVPQEIQELAGELIQDQYKQSAMLMV